MWKEIESSKMKLGVGTVDMCKRRFVLGAATVRVWHLDKYSTVTPSNNVPPPDYGEKEYADSSMVAFQFYKNGEGKRKLMVARSGEKTLYVNCQPALKKAGAMPGRYKIRKINKGFLIVDFLRGKVDQFSPRR